MSKDEKEYQKAQSAMLDWERVNSDINGNPRYVLHFLNIASDYETAVKLANKIGGRKYHTKGYGGGIVFQSYSLHATEEAISRIKQTKTEAN